MTKTLISLSLAFLIVSSSRCVAQTDFLPGHRSLPDAHNCYPYGEWWHDRIDRALAGGVPVAIEQDLYWYKKQGEIDGRSVVAHSPPLNGKEPNMENYFFERIRPLIEAALRNPDHSQWPIVTLNLDIKTQEPEHLRAIRGLLLKYESWLTTAERTSDGSTVQPLRVGPVLILNGPADSEQRVFYDEIPVGGRLITFGAVPTNMSDIKAAPDLIETAPESNYRRWWNNPWPVIESDGQQRAGEWSEGKSKRLQAFVSHAHKQGLWIRFYTLDGADQKEQSANGWAGLYNFASIQDAMTRWVQSTVDGVDFIASDQYELEASTIRAVRTAIHLPRDANQP